MADAVPLVLFVSYARTDAASADRLVADLEARGFKLLIDRRDLPYGEAWKEELSGFIRAADTVIWLVSPASVASRWCLWELSEVKRLGKRLVPLRVAPVPSADLPADLGRVHALPAEGCYQPAAHLDLLVTALKTNRAWLKEGTRLADRALQWRGKQESPALLLRAAALADAEAWVSAAPAEAPAPPAEVLALVLASRQARSRRQRLAIVSALGGLLVAAVLTAFAVLQALEAERQAEIARQNEARAAEARDEALAHLADLVRSRAAMARQNLKPEVALALLLKLAEDPLFATLEERPDAAALLAGLVGEVIQERVAPCDHFGEQPRLVCSELVVLLPDGPALLASVYDREQERRDLHELRSLPDGRLLARLDLRASGYAEVAYLGEGRFLVTSEEGKRTLWGLPEELGDTMLALATLPEVLREVDGTPGRDFSSASADGAWLLLATQLSDHWVPRVTHAVSLAEGGVRPIDGSGSLRFVEAAMGGSLERAIPSSQFALLEMRGGLALLAAESNELALLDLSTGDWRPVVVPFFAFDQGVTGEGSLWSYDGERIVLSDPGDGRILAERRLQADHLVTVEPPGDLLAAYRCAGEVELFSLATLEPLARLLNPESCSPHLPPPDPQRSSEGGIALFLGGQRPRLAFLDANFAPQRELAVAWGWSGGFDLDRSGDWALEAPSTSYGRLTPLAPSVEALHAMAREELGNLAALPLDELLALAE